MQQLLRLLLFLIIATTQGCQLINKYRTSAETIPITEEQEQIFSLLRQGKRYDELSDPHRQAVCKRLKLDYQQHADWQTAWLLVYSLNDEFNCISLNDTLILLVAIQAAHGSSSYLHWLNKNQMKLLMDLNTYHKNRNSLRVQLKNSKEQLKDSQELLKKENTKIEELKAIETSINKKLDD